MTMYSASQALPRFARILVLLCLFASSGAWATLDLNGVSYHKEYGEEQYMAALYLEDLSSDAKEILLSDQRKRMEIKVVAKACRAIIRTVVRHAVASVRARTCACIPWLACR